MVTTIDCHYLGRPGFAAAYLLVQGGRAAFVDNNCNAALPHLVSALEAARVAPENVDYLIVTHVRLDECDNGTAEVACEDPGAGGEEVTIADPVNGGTYFVFVDGSYASGDYVL